MAEHILLTVADYWDAVARGAKTFEVRINDRGFQAGDILHLRRADRDQYRSPCMDPACTHVRCLDQWLTRRVTYVYAGDRTLRDAGGLIPGWVVLGLEEISDG